MTILQLLPTLPLFSFPRDVLLLPLWLVASGSAGELHGEGLIEQRKSGSHGYEDFTLAYQILGGEEEYEYNGRSEMVK